eukprot:CAMPEP_0197646028 /NCGR_PEP_ID=MMETSP1338-20131121/21580_1 /TAXON_ID=43686 ORGANISM="Pelagodinium beii, Strain RCC1491" /NCGR_SAMPLE_ID=MMETSP1338 /ASSEMBLY_ACC=CAM_ASM_000754 /LENGTH=46 /DNA_ID= /DNA_START= /DNA_END= /DNA_ORIENTATION=
MVAAPAAVLSCMLRPAGAGTKLLWRSWHSAATAAAATSVLLAFAIA